MRHRVNRFPHFEKIDAESDRYVVQLLQSPICFPRSPLVIFRKGCAPEKGGMTPSLKWVETI